MLCILSKSLCQVLPLLWAEPYAWVCDTCSGPKITSRMRNTSIITPLAVPLPQALTRSWYTFAHALIICLYCTTKFN